MIVKPHPSNDHASLARALAEAGVRKWRISHESIYALVPSIDFVVSLYSTVFFMPAMASKPVMFVPNAATLSVVDRWDKLSELYRGFEFFLDDLADVPRRLPELLDIARKQRDTGQRLWSRDAEHLRQFYPDGALGRCLERLYPRDD